MRAFLSFSAFLVVFATSAKPASAQGTATAKKTDSFAKCKPAWIKLGLEERQGTPQGGSSASLLDEIDRLVKESDALDGVQLFLSKSTAGRSIESEEGLKQVDAQHLSAELRKAVEGLQAFHELRAAFAARDRDVPGIERSLAKLREVTGDADLARSLWSGLIAGNRGRKADLAEASARAEKVVAGLRERVAESWKVECRDFARRAALARNRAAKSDRVGFAARPILRTNPQGGGALPAEQDDDDQEYIKQVEKLLGPPPLSAAEKSLVRLMRRRALSEAKVVAVLRKSRSAITD